MHKRLMKQLDQQILSRTPESMKKFLSTDQIKLYDLYGQEHFITNGSCKI